MRKSFRIIAMVLVLVMCLCIIPQTTLAAGKDGWRKENGKWYYYTNGAKAKNCWKYINGHWFWFDSKGVMATGWAKINGKWYFFYDWECAIEGIMMTYYQKLDGKWYYLDEYSGAMRTGWVYTYQWDGNNSHYGWTYHLGNGEAAVGWRKINGVWYYFMEGGSIPEMACNETLTINGVQYTFDSSGAWVK